MILAAKDFKAVVAAAGKFPGAGDFAGAGDYVMRAAKGSFTLAASGVVSTWAKRKCEGDLASVAVDMRRVDGFAALCVPGRRVTVEMAQDVLTMTSGPHRITSPVKQAAWRPAPRLDIGVGRTAIPVTAAMAQRCNYLAEVAFADGSRAELSCVMMAQKSAMACNQTTVATFHVDSRFRSRVPVPLPVARVIAEGDTLHVGAADVVLRSGCAVYLAPAAVKAYTDFPLDALTKYGEQTVTEVAVCSGDKLAAALANCAAVLEPLSKLDIVISLKIDEKYIRLSGINSGAKFSTRIPVIRQMEMTEFRLPLGEVKKVFPFMRGKVVLTRGRHGDMLMKLADGWTLFPAWIDPGRQKKK